MAPIPHLHDRVLFALASERRPVTFARLCTVATAPAGDVAGIVLTMAGAGLLVRSWTGRPCRSPVAYSLRHDLLTRIEQACQMPDKDARVGRRSVPA